MYYFYIRANVVMYISILFCCVEIYVYIYICIIYRKIPIKKVQQNAVPMYQASSFRCPGAMSAPDH